MQILREEGFQTLYSFFLVQKMEGNDTNVKKNLITQKWEDRWIFTYFVAVTATTAGLTNTIIFTHFSFSIIYTLDKQI